MVGVQGKLGRRWWGSRGRWVGCDGSPGVGYRGGGGPSVDG